MKLSWPALNFQMPLVFFVAFINYSVALAGPVDLSDVQGSTDGSPLREHANQHVLAKPGYQNLDIYGSGGIMYADSGNNGTNATSTEDSPAKSFNLKLYGNPLDFLYISLSYIDSPDTRRMGLWLVDSVLSRLGEAP